VGAGLAAVAVPALAATQLTTGESTLTKQVPIGTDSSGRTWNLGGFSGLFPLGGMNDANVDVSSPAGWVNVAWHLTLPCLTLTLAYLAQYQLVMRASMLDEMGQDYVRTARAKGLRDLAVRRRHVVPNALLPAVTQILLYFGFVISGALTVEYVFSWPGLGLLTEDAISGADYPLLRGLFLLFTASVIVCNLLADVGYAFLDPRIRYR